MFDTIAAISTGVINQPISIIRLSGDQAFMVMRQIFQGKVGKHQTITLGYIHDAGVKVDEVLVNWFKGPQSFTGEDVVEINAHGGVLNTNKILELCLSHGARLATRGEFSRRAFLNGKMDLIKAEAIHDLIFAKTDLQAKLAVQKFDGRTSHFVGELKKQILNIIATIETNIDYPEYDDVAQLTTQTLLPALSKVQTELKATLNLAHDARFNTNGINLAIVGKPNAGKSTLLNALIQEDKAIVTATPGTTRDIVEGQFVFQGLMLNLIDTAGIRSTDNEIEKQGIAKSLAQIKKADLIVHLIDPTTEETAEDTMIFKASQNKIYLKVYAKADLKQHQGINIAAKLNQIEPLLKAIKKHIPHINIHNDHLITNARQLALINKANMALLNAIEALNSGFEPDEVIIDVRAAWEHLMNITGQASNEKLLDQMFANFCLGK